MRRRSRRITIRRRRGSRKGEDPRPRRQSFQSPQSKTQIQTRLDSTGLILVLLLIILLVLLLRIGIFMHKLMQMLPSNQMLQKTIPIQILILIPQNAHKLMYSCIDNTNTNTNINTNTNTSFDYEYHNTVLYYAVVFATTYCSISYCPIPLYYHKVLARAPSMIMSPKHGPCSLCACRSFEPATSLKASWKTLHRQVFTFRRPALTEGIPGAKG